MKEVCYTSALEAEYMIQNFGLKIHKDNDCKYIVSKESYSLLRPQKGDLIHTIKGSLSIYTIVDDIVINRKILTGVWCNGSFFGFSIKNPTDKIIQRNLKAFFTPKIILIENQ